MEEFVSKTDEERVEADAFPDGVAAGNEAPKEFCLLGEKCAGGFVGEVVVGAWEVGFDCFQHVFDVVFGEEAFYYYAAVAEEDLDFASLVNRVEVVVISVN